MASQGNGHLLDPVCAKLARAHQHLEAFNSTLDEWTESGSYRVRKEYDAKTGWYTWTWVELRPPPVLLSLTFGDHLGLLRSTLDYLAQALVRTNGRNPRERVVFPVLLDSKNWDSDRTKAAVKGIHADWVAQIKRLQPYHRGNQAKREPLAVLNRLANRDKHRLLNFFTVSAAEVKFRGDTPPDFPGGVLETNLLPEGHRLENGTVIARVRTIPPHKIDVDMNRNVQISIQLDDPGPLPTGDFPDLLSEVQRVINIFMPAFV